VLTHQQACKPSAACQVRERRNPWICTTGQLSRTGPLQGDGFIAYLITKGVPSNDDGLHPSRNGFGNLGQDNWFTENRATKDVSNLRITVRAEIIRGERLTVPLGLFHISLSLNSSTRASSGVMVAHLMPTLYFRMALAASTVTWSFVWIDTKLASRGFPSGIRTCLVAILQPQVVVLDI
jgi:hypothetical protein